MSRIFSKKTGLSLFLAAMVYASHLQLLAMEDDFPIQFTLIGFDIKPGSKEEKTLRNIAKAAGGNYLSVKGGDKVSLRAAILKGVREDSGGAKVKIGQKTSNEWESLGPRHKAYSFESGLKGEKPNRNERSGDHQWEPLGSGKRTMEEEGSSY